MIGSIQNRVIFSTENVPVKSQGLIELLPQKNSIVIINVLEKIGGKYKLLINGSVFQAELPVNIQIGEQILAKVISQKPLVFELANLFVSNKINKNLLSVLLAKLNINDNELSKDVLKEVLSSKKPIVKANLENLINFIAQNNKIEDRLYLNFLINFFLDTDKKNGKSELKKLAQALNISFKELAEKLFNYIILANRLYPTSFWTAKLNQIFIYDPKKFVKDTETISVSNKSEKIIDFLNSFHLIEELLPNEKSDLKHLLIKYVLQKAVYGTYNLHPEFTILKTEKEFILLLFRTDILKSKDGKISFFINLDLTTEDYGDILFKGYYSLFKLTGEIISDINGITFYNKIAEIINNSLKNKLDIETNIFTSLKREGVKINRIDKAGSINFMA